MTEWSKLKVPELKAELKKRGLPQNGLKADLVARLTTIDNELESESEATIKGDTVGASPELNSQTSVADEPKTPQIESQDEGKTLVPSRQPAYEPVAAPSTSAPHASAATIPDVQSYKSLAASSITTDPLTSKNEVGLPSNMSAMSSGYLKEVVEDTQKRKRRSQSPPLSTDDRSKRARPEYQSDVKGVVEIQARKDEVVTSADDARWVEDHNRVEPAETNAQAIETTSSIPRALPATNVVDVAMEDVIVEPAVANTTEVSPGEEKRDVATPREGRQGTSPVSSKPPRDGSSPKTRDFRKTSDGGKYYADDHVVPKSVAPLNSSKPIDLEPVDRLVAPSIHSATSALYIRNFMRPLNLATLQEHITNLATAPGTVPDRDVVVDFYLDPIRTHAFVSFKSVSAASRVRSQLHDRIWPNETNRKPLWVDFIPYENVRRWIVEEEESAGAGRTVSKKWEVVYSPDDYRDVTAILQEVGSFVAPARKPAVTSTPSAAPSHAGVEGAPSGPRSQQITTRAPPSRTHLDLLFKSTNTQPVLYFQPVSRELAEKRLDHLEDATSKRYNSQDPPGEINRYTFEEGDVLADRGPEIFPGIRPPPGHRGRGSGGRGLPRGGGYRDRADTYRDRGEGHGDRDDGYGSRGNGYGNRGDGYGSRGDARGGRGDGHGIRVDGLGSRGDGYGRRGDGYGRRGDGYGYTSRGDGYRGRGGRYEGGGRDVRDSRDRRY